MTIAEWPLSILNQSLILTNQRVVYWPLERALVLSDLHIGKAAHFRRNGIPISSSIQEDDLTTLESLINHYKPKQLIVVGDLFHASKNSDFRLFFNWRNKFADIKIRLIKGNHDRLKSSIYEDFEIDCCQTHLDIGQFRFVHEPALCKESFCISGHIHPGVTIKYKAKQRIKLPCFQVSNNQLVLPAFSKFTGLDTSKKDKSTEMYAFTDASIFKF